MFRRQHLCRVLGEIVAPAGEAVHLAPGLHDRLTHLINQNPAQALAVGADVFGGAVHQRLPLAEGGPPP